LPFTVPDASLSASFGRRERGTMRVSLTSRRPPSVVEQLLGRRRARLLRRRLAFLALGTGVTLLRPRTRWAPMAMTAAIVLGVVVGFNFLS
jgi:hypothetical protein